MLLFATSLKRKNVSFYYVAQLIHSELKKKKKLTEKYTIAS